LLQPELSNATSNSAAAKPLVRFVLARFSAIAMLLDLLFFDGE
jgi:hypothetical protein